MSIRFAFFLSLIVLISFLFAIRCEKTEMPDPGPRANLEIPESLQKCRSKILLNQSLSDDCYHETSRQFGSADFPSLQYSYVNGDRVNLRDAPSLVSGILQSLPISSRVNVLYRKDEKEEINGSTGHWAFVAVSASSEFANNEKKERYGWIFDPFISTRDDFSQSGIPFEGHFCCGLIDSRFCIVPDSKGNAILKTWEKEEGIVVLEGQLMTHKNLFFFLTAKDSSPVVLVKKNGKLFTEIYYGFRENDDSVLSLFVEHL